MPEAGWKEELVQNWGVVPNGVCCCGCGDPVGQRSLVASGHDLRVSPRLLKALLTALRGNASAERVVQQVIGR